MPQIDLMLWYLSKVGYDDEDNWSVFLITWWLILLPILIPHINKLSLDIFSILISSLDAVMNYETNSTHVRLQRCMSNCEKIVVPSCHHPRINFFRTLLILIGHLCFVLRIYFWQLFFYIYPCYLSKVGYDDKVIGPCFWVHGDWYTNTNSVPVLNDLCCTYILVFSHFLYILYVLMNYET